MFLCSVVLFNVFSASYTSFLSVVKTAQPFSNIQELEKSSFKIGAPPGSTYKINFEVFFKKKQPKKYSLLPLAPRPSCKYQPRWNSVGDSHQHWGVQKDEDGGLCLHPGHPGNIQGAREGDIQYCDLLVIIYFQSSLERPATSWRLDRTSSMEI